MITIEIKQRKQNWYWELSEDADVYNVLNIIHQIVSTLMIKFSIPRGL